MKPENERPLRIAMFTNNYYPFIGGVPVSIDRLVSGLRAMGHTVVVFAPLYPGQEPDTDPDIIRCELLTYRRTEVFNYAVVNLFSQSINEEFARRGFDIVHVHHPFWMGTKGMNMGRKHGIPVVLTYHTRFDRYYHYMPVMKGFFKRYMSHSIVKYFAGRCDAVIAPTRTSMEYLRGLGITRPIEIIPTGVEMYADEAAEPPELARDGGALLCSVSRLAKEKNIFFLLEGIKRVKARCKVPFRCVLIGDGPEREEIERAVRVKGLSQTVLLTGSVEPDMVKRYYLASELFVFASKTETQGMVLAEAMAGRCPVVAVSSGGVDDVIMDGINGYKTHEDADEWARRVTELLENDKKRHEMAQNAYETAKQYSVEEMAEKAVYTYRRARESVFGLPRR